MKKAEVKRNKPVYLGMSILDTTKTTMYEFCYDYIKPKYQGRAKLFYMGTEALLFIFKLKIFTNIANDVEKWFDTSNYDENEKRPLPIGKTEKVIGFF